MNFLVSYGITKILNPLDQSGVPSCHCFGCAPKFRADKMKVRVGAYYDQNLQFGGLAGAINGRILATVRLFSGP